MRILSFLLFILLVGNGAAQELVGTDHVLPGTLASFEVIPVQEASWHIVAPATDNGIYQVDTGLSKLYFASPVPGRYSVIAGIVTDGKPQLLVKTFVNGEEDLIPVPVPIPPVPPVSSLEDWIKTQLPILVKSTNPAAESRLIAECFDQIVQRIETENIKTVQNAQAQIQVTLIGTLALASPTAVTDWTPFLSELSQRLETELGDKITDLAEVKKVFLVISNAMKLPNDVRTPLQNIDNPTNRGRGIHNRLFQSLLTR